jgi:hypothetical protein
LALLRRLGREGKLAESASPPMSSCLAKDNLPKALLLGAITSGVGKSNERISQLIERLICAVYNLNVSANYNY